MYVSKLSLTNFRSYAQLDLSLTPGVTTFIGNNGAGKTNTYTIRKNGSNTTLTCSMTNATSCNDTTHSFTVAAGDEVGLARDDDGTFDGVVFFEPVERIFQRYGRPSRESAGIRVVTGARGAGRWRARSPAP